MGFRFLMNAMIFANPLKVKVQTYYKNKCHQLLVAFVLYRTLKAFELLLIVNCSLPIELNDVHCLHKESTNERKDHSKVVKTGSNSKKERCS